MSTVLVQESKGSPSRTAFRIPSGIEMKYVMSVIQSPSEIETGIFSLMSSITDTSRK